MTSFHNAPMTDWPPSEPHTLHRVALLPEMAGWRLDRALAASLPAQSRTRLRRLVSAGHVRAAGALLRDPARKVQGDEALLVAIPVPRPAAHPAQDIPLAILYEDADLLVVDKPAGLVVHPAAGNPDGTLVNALLHHCAGRLSGLGGVARPGIVHRLDKDTSGLLVVARTDPAHERLARQFHDHSVERHYLAVVAGVPVPPAGMIVRPLARAAGNRKKVIVVPEGEGREAVTRYRVLGANPAGTAALVECRLETGRTHQIRVHMTHIGHPLIGDPVYGRGRVPAALRKVTSDLGFTRQALHARHLGFLHPTTGAKMAFDSPPPEDIQTLLSNVGL